MGVKNGGSVKMTKDEILKGIEAMQRVQAANPPSSKKWQRASRVLHELIKQMAGKYPQEARG
jgi:hypothetical protein